MGRDWTPRELYTADKVALRDRGESIRDVTITFHNRITGENEPIYNNPGQQDFRKTFPEFGFLYNDTEKFRKKYLEYERELNIVSVAIESELRKNEGESTREDAINDILSKNPEMYKETSFDYMKDKVEKCINTEIEGQKFSSCITKWFNGKLSQDFYYSTENDEKLMEVLDKSILEAVREKCKEFGRVSTHSSIAHSDDVFSTAFIEMLYENTGKKPEIIICSDESTIPENPNKFVCERNLNIPQKDNVLVFDKGRGKFDHHQKDNEIRENGIPYASIGKLWREFSKYLIIDNRLATKNERDIVQSKLIEKIDATDNGVGHDDISSLIAMLNPINRPEKETIETENEMFRKMFDIAKLTLNRSLDKAVTFGKELEVVQEALKNKNNLQNGVLFIEGHASVDEPSIWHTLNENNVDFILSKDNGRGTYNIRQVPQELGGRDGRVPFPKEWLGQDENYLKGHITSHDIKRRNPEIKDHITFCHSGNWLMAVDSKNDKDAFEIAEVISQVCHENKEKEIGKETDDILK